MSWPANSRSRPKRLLTFCPGLASRRRRRTRARSPLTLPKKFASILWGKLEAEAAAEAAAKAEQMRKTRRQRPQDAAGSGCASASRGCSERGRETRGSERSAGCTAAVAPAESPAPAPPAAAAPQLLRRRLLPAVATPAAQAPAATTPAAPAVGTASAPAAPASRAPRCAPQTRAVHAASYSTRVQPTHCASAVLSRDRLPRVRPRHPGTHPAAARPAAGATPAARPASPLSSADAHGRIADRFPARHLAAAAPRRTTSWPADATDSKSGQGGRPFTPRPGGGRAVPEDRVVHGRSRPFGSETGRGADRVRARDRALRDVRRCLPPFPDKMPPKAEPGKPLYTRKPTQRQRPMVDKREMEGERKLHPTRQRPGAGGRRSWQR